MTFLLLLLACPETVSTVDSTDYFPGDVDADGYTTDEGDCNDEDRAVNPGAVEIWYDGADQNCDGNDDDQDLDGSAVEEDCNDLDATAFPDNPELCDGVDNDCDDKVDEGVEDGIEVYPDEDGDGWAASRLNSVVVCDGDDVPLGYTENTGDCDDTDRGVAPDALELCDGLDNDCDGEVDEAAADRTFFYQDLDGDGYGTAAASVAGCEAPEGYADNTEDCDDTNAGVAPGTDESCDLLDNDCDGRVDEAAVDRVTVYDDADGDGYGVTGTDGIGCAYDGALVDGDCDDTLATVNPGAAEYCDTVDNDCDGTVDEDVVVAPYYTDGDGDGYGDALAGEDCVLPAGTSFTSGDCDDTATGVNPAATEVCNGVDDDCNGTPDDGATDTSVWYLDADADGYGVSTDSTEACSASGDYSASEGGDCDDSSDDAFPGATETTNGGDDDCDGYTDENLGVAGSLLITEVARQTWMGGASTDADGQWFEVYNASGETLYLYNWTVSRTNTDVGSDSFQVDPAEAGMAIPAGDYAVFCATDVWLASSSADSTLECDYVWGDVTLPDDYSDTYLDNTFHLQRDEDTLSLAVDGVVVDSVTWTYDAVEGYWPREATRSMGLTAAAYDATANDDETNWCEATADIWYDDGVSDAEYGTPGAANEVCP